MAEQSKYHITFVSCNEDTDIPNLEALLQQRFKLSPARASQFFHGDEKIITSDRDKAKKFRQYFLKQGVVVSITPANKKRPFFPAEETQPKAQVDSPTEPDSTALLALQDRLTKTEKQLSVLEQQQRAMLSKLAQLQQVLASQHAAVETHANETIEVKTVEEEVLEATKNSEIDLKAINNADISKPKPKWKRVALAMVLACMGGAGWIMQSPQASKTLQDLLYQLPFMDRTPAIATALQAKPDTTMQLNQLAKAYLQEQQGSQAETPTPEQLAKALIYASEQNQMSIEGLIAVVEVQRCTDHRLKSDLSFLETQLESFIWSHLTSNQLMQFGIMGKETHKLVQIGADGCGSEGSNVVVAKLAFDAYIQKHLQ